MKIPPSKLQEIAELISERNKKQISESYNEAYVELSKLSKYKNSSRLYCQPSKPIKRGIVHIKKRRIICRCCGKNFWLYKNINQKIPVCSKKSCKKAFNLFLETKRATAKIRRESEKPWRFDRSAREDQAINFGEQFSD